MDALCGAVFSYLIYIQYDTTQINTIQGLYSLYSRVVALFDSVEYECHEMWMDNLYKYVALFSTVYNHPGNILALGMIRKVFHIIPTCVQKKSSNIG